MFGFGKKNKEQSVLDALAGTPDGEQRGVTFALGAQQMPGSVITKERLQEAMQTLRRYKAGKANFEARCIENEQWWKLRHWEMIREKPTTTLQAKSAWLVNVVLSKHADAMDAYPEPSCLPREAGDQAEADILSAVVPVVLQQNEFEKVWSDNWWKKLKAGVAIYGVFWDKDKLGGLGDVAIRKIDPLCLFWEPGITDLQRSRNLFHVELVDNAALEELYPQLQGKLGSKNVTLGQYLYDDRVDTTEKSPVIDWYYKKRVGGRTVLHYVKFVGETVLFATEDDRSGGVGSDQGSVVSASSAAERSFPERISELPAGAEDGRSGLGPLQWQGMAAAGGGMAERGLYDHGMYPFFFDVLFPEEGTLTGYGYIDICKDAQRQIDLMNTAIVGNCVAAATPRWLKRGDDGINEQEYADWTKPFVHVQGSLEESSMRPITVSPLTGNYLNILISKIDEMKETSGNRDVNNGGAPSGVTAASAIAAMQEQSGKLSRDQIQGSYRCFRQIVYCVIELIRQFYTVPRTFRIVGQDNVQVFAPFDNHNLVPQPQPVQFGEEPSMRLPVFDIEVTSAKQSSYSKLSYNELAIQFFQLGFFNPQLADQATAAMKMMDFKGKEQVRRNIEQNGGMWQQMQQMQQVIKLMAQRLGLQGGQPAEGPAPRSRGGQPVRIEQTDALGGQQKRNAIVEKARSKANESTQPE